MNKLDTLTPVLVQSIGETVYMSPSRWPSPAVAGLAIGRCCTPRAGPATSSPTAPCSSSRNLVINLIRPIPFIIFLTAVAPSPVP